MAEITASNNRISAMLAGLSMSELNAVCKTNVIRHCVLGEFGRVANGVAPTHGMHKRQKNTTEPAGPSAAPGSS